MGRIADAANRLKNVLGDLFSEDQPSATPVFPTNAPTPISEPVITIRKSSQTTQATPNPESKSTPYGKITSYNWKGDPYTDSQSRAMIGSFGKLTEQGMAVSPDIERQFKEMGIKPKDKVLLTLADGTQMERRWEDRTMQDKQAIRKFGKPLTGRFDLNFPQGTKPHEKDGLAVVGFQKIASAE
jgi:hypothetical protein